MDEEVQLVFIYQENTWQQSDIDVRENLKNGHIHHFKTFDQLMHAFICVQGYPLLQ